MCYYSWRCQRCATIVDNVVRQMTPLQPKKSQIVRQGRFSQCALITIKSSSIMYSCILGFFNASKHTTPTHYWWVACSLCTHSISAIARRITCLEQAARSSPEEEEQVASSHRPTARASRAVGTRLRGLGSALPASRYCTQILARANFHSTSAFSWASGRRRGEAEGGGGEGAVGRNGYTLGIYYNFNCLT